MFSVLFVACKIRQCVGLFFILNEKKRVFLVSVSFSIVRLVGRSFMKPI